MVAADKGDFRALTALVVNCRGDKIRPGPLGEEVSQEDQLNLVGLILSVYCVQEQLELNAAAVEVANNDVIQGLPLPCDLKKEPSAHPWRLCTSFFGNSEPRALLPA